MKKHLWIVLVLAALALFVLPACGLTSDMKSASDTGKAFMTALKDNDNQASWALVSADIKDEIGGFDSWEAFTAPRQFEDFSFNSTNIEKSKATLEGEGTLAGDTYIITLILTKSGDNWLVAGLDFSLK